MIKHHWGLKLLALLFACATWLVSTGRDFTSIDSVPVVIKLTPPQDGVLLAVDGNLARKEVEFAVSLHGPRLSVEQLLGKVLTINYAFDGVRVEEIRNGEPREELVKLNEQMLSHLLPKDVKVTAITPETRAVKIDRLIGRRMQVETTLVYSAEEDGSRRPVEKDGDGCLDGFRIVGHNVIPRHVTAVGPQSVLHNREKVQAQPALVDRLNRNADRRVSIIPYVETEEYGRVAITCDEEITIGIEVAEFPVEGLLKNVPVRLLRPLTFLYAVHIKEIDGRTVEPGSPVTIDLPIIGAGHRVREIEEAFLRADIPDVRLMLDVTDVTRDGTSEKPLKVFLPDRIRIDRRRMPTDPVAKYEVTFPLRPD